MAESAPGVPDPATYSPKFLLTDHLGTTRAELTFNSSHSPVISKIYDYMPYGEEISPAAGVTEQLKFTGKQRDSESGLDFFGARYYGNTLYRWTSPDAPFEDNRLEDPQSWNLYGYVRNNPIIHVDPNGEELELIGKTEAERKQAMYFLRDGLKEAGNALDVKEVTEGGKTRYIVTIKGDVETFKKTNEAAKLLADIIDPGQPTVEFAMTDRNLQRYGGAATLKIGEDKAEPNTNVRVLIPLCIHNDTNPGPVC